MVHHILKNWLTEDPLEIKDIGSGLIHKTYLAKYRQESFVLQKINVDVFKKPHLISENLERIGEFLRKKDPDYLFPIPLKSLKKTSLVEEDGYYWRLSPFVPNSVTINVVTEARYARSAAAAFGEFASKLDGFPTEILHYTIPRFHDLTLRFEQFQNAKNNASLERRKKAFELVKSLDDLEWIVQYFVENKYKWPLRVQHHDTKINNILFEQGSEKALAICDLDTIMPGYFLSDLGDMIRTYTSSEDEESVLWQKIEVTEEMLKALLQGYLEKMGIHLSPAEKSDLRYSGLFIIYMQALRFLTDYLEGDRYYPVQHAEHNFNRAKNQICLLKSYEEGFSSQWFLSL